MFTCYPTHKKLNLRHCAEAIRAKWEQENSFHQSISKRSDQESFQLYEGPPSANGNPGIHHAFTRTIKDIFGRYKTMQGYHVLWKSGWDTHGLPVELQVEKELGITKKEIGTKISIEAYNKRCRSTVLRYQKEWENFTKALGYWTDLENPYITCDNQYISSVWHLLKLLYDKELLYEGYAIQPYSPAAGTGLSSHELNQPGCYREVSDLSIVVQFKLLNHDNTYLLAWTTTPWTLPANSAVAINKKLSYLLIATFNRYTGDPIQVIIAKEAVERYFEDNQSTATMQPPKEPSSPLPWRIKRCLLGKELIGEHYQPLFNYIVPKKKAFEVMHADFITTSEGTGMVHIAPSFGSDDYKLAKAANLDDMTLLDKEGRSQPIVDGEGRYHAAITPWAGRYVKSAYEKKSTEELPVDVLIAKQLKKKNQAFLVQKYKHNYPHCWRTNQPILYYPMRSWFIKSSTKREQLLAHNQSIQWKPASTGSGRFGNWLANINDWNLSRSRFWGTPLPIWESKDKKERRCIGSLSALRAAVNEAVAAQLMDAPLPENIDLHRPYLDEIVLLSLTKQPMYRIPDVIDVWFDSGAMPYAAQSAYPTNAKMLPPTFPADFISEGVDQTRGWFFTMHVISVLLFDQPAYRNVLATGLVLDKKGQKMSKSLGNTLDPHKLLQKYGPDVLRWYMMSNSFPWEDMKFDPDQLKEVTSKFFGTLHNTYQFFALYANIDRFVPSSLQQTLAAATQDDRWILARLQRLIKQVQNALNDYVPTPAVRAIEQFVIQDLSNWYVRLNRTRFWQSANGADKQAAYQTLYICLKNVAELIAPLAPFYSEQLYQNLHPTLVAHSVHWQDYPKVVKKYCDEALQQQMLYAQQISSMVHSLRKQYKIKVRQPLPQLLLAIQNKKIESDVAQVASIIAKEVNVKQLKYVTTKEVQLIQKVSPNFRKLGASLGKRLPWLMKKMKQLSQQEIIAMKERGNWEWKHPEGNIVLTSDQWQITTEDLPGWAAANQGDLTVALDLTITEALLAEGWARELINRIQNSRKNAGLSVETKIVLHFYSESNQWKHVLQSQKKNIMEQVQAADFQQNKQPLNKAAEEKLILKNEQINYLIQAI